MLLHVGGDLILGRHVIVEPDEAKNDTHGFGDALVVGERHGLVQRDFDHLDKLPLPGLTSARAHTVVIGNLRVEHGLLSACHADAWPAQRKPHIPVNGGNHFGCLSHKTNKGKKKKKVEKHRIGMDRKWNHCLSLSQTDLEVEIKMRFSRRVASLDGSRTTRSTGEQGRNGQYISRRKDAKAGTGRYQARRRRRRSERGPGVIWWDWSGRRGQGSNAGRRLAVLETSYNTGSTLNIEHKQQSNTLEKKTALVHPCTVRRVSSYLIIALHRVELLSVLFTMRL